MEHNLNINQACFGGIVTRKYDGKYGGGASFHIEIECQKIGKVEKNYEVCCHATDVEINKLEINQKVVVQGAFYLKKQWVANNLYVFPEIYDCQIIS